MFDDLRVLKEHCFLEGFQVLRVCPSGKEQRVDADLYETLVE